MCRILFLFLYLYLRTEDILHFPPMFSACFCGCLLLLFLPVLFLLLDFFVCRFFVGFSTISQPDQNTQKGGKKNAFFLFLFLF